MVSFFDRTGVKPGRKHMRIRGGTFARRTVVRRTRTLDACATLWKGTRDTSRRSIPSRDRYGPSGRAQPEQATVFPLQRRGRVRSLRAGKDAEQQASPSKEGDQG